MLRRVLKTRRDGCQRRKVRRGRRYVPHADLQSTGNVSFEEVKNAYPRTKGEMAQVDSRAGGRFASFSALYR
eukprot:scaffold300092_cov33-Tisochrysis_lutea.AAC.1